MNFPDGNSEEFLMAELPYLLKEFDEIRVYPIYPGTIENQRRLPDRVKVIHHGVQVEDRFSLVLFMNNFIKLVSVFFLDLSYYGVLKIMKNIKYWFIYSNKILAMHEFLKYEIEGVPASAFYSYWSLDWLSVFSIKDFRKEKTLVSRMLGIDVYEERHSNGFVPWRRFSLKGAKVLVPNSLKSLQYVKSKHPGLIVRQGYLGSIDINTTIVEQNELVLLSSSRLIDLKRVHLIPSIIIELSEPIKWKHWGDEGQARERVLMKANSLLEKDSFEFNRHRSNVNELYKFYNENNNAIFIHLSTTEGLPTCLVEATSMGFPIICTDAGGSNEVVENGVNGFVVPVDFKIDEVVKLLESLICDSDMRSKFGKASREIYLKKFVANKIYAKFLKENLN